MSPPLSILEFLSTPSARRATSGGTLFCCFLAISIHALREEGDDIIQDYVLEGKKFLSTPSARRATQKAMATAYCQNDFYPRPPRGGRPADKRDKLLDLWISIHALREEGDALYDEVGRFQSDFYPRPPRGGRPLRVTLNG